MKMKNKFASTPYLLWAALFVIIPMVLVVYFALTSQSGQFTLDNITAVGEYADVFIRSLWLALLATAICLLLGYPLAYIIARSGKIAQRTLVMLLMLPMWMNFLLRTYAWMTLLEDNGLINRFLGIFGLHWHIINTEGAVVLGMVYNFLPFMILPLYSVMTKLDKSILNAARDLGASGWQVFYRIVFPLTVPGILSGVTMTFVPAVSTFVISRLLGGGGNLLIGDLIELQILGASYNLHAGAAMSLILMVVILICMGLMNSLDDEEMEAMIV